MRVKCTRCFKYIRGTVKVSTYRRKLGAKSLNKVEYYDENCFKLLSKERATNEHREKERTSKRKSTR